jgi:branched-chain amino acid transport system permease protein
LFLQQLINGLTLGTIYGLIALGYTMVYGVLKFINFAHGEIFMFGAYFSLLGWNLLKYLPFFQNNLFLSLSFIFFIGMAGASILGVVIERIAYRPLRAAPRLAALLTALGISIFLQNLAMLIFGPTNKIFPEVFPLGGISLAKVTVSYLKIFLMGTSILLMITLQLFIKKTKLGKAIRAVSQNREIAGLMGINVNKIIVLTFLIGSCLGGGAGVMVGMNYGVVKYDMGYIAGLKAFTAAVLGGIGNITGAMLGGLLIGLIESLGAGYISSQYKDVFAFIVLILVLVFRPEGILGERIPEKV